MTSECPCAALIVVVRRLRTLSPARSAVSLLDIVCQKFVVTQ